MPFEYANDEKIHQGVYGPKNRRFVRPSREITAKTLLINNFQTVQFSHLHILYHLKEIIADLSESAKNIQPQCPLAEIFELVYQCPML